MCPGNIKTPTTTTLSQKLDFIWWSLKAKWTQSFSPWFFSGDITCFGTLIPYSIWVEMWFSNEFFLTESRKIRAFLILSRIKTSHTVVIPVILSTSGFFVPFGSYRDKVPFFTRGRRRLVTMNWDFISTLTYIKGSFTVASFLFFVRALNIFLRLRR